MTPPVEYLGERYSVPDPVLYMSRATAREVWRLVWNSEPDLTGELTFGRFPVLFDDQMQFGTARLEQNPETQTTR